MASQYFSSSAGGVRSEYIATSNNNAAPAAPSSAPQPPPPVPVAPAPTNTAVPPKPDANTGSAMGSAMGSTMSTSGIGGPVSARSSHFDILGDIAAGRFGGSNSDYFKKSEGQDKLQAPPK